MHAITEKAMTLNLSVGMWQGYRLDRAESKRVTDENGAASDAARVNKHLIPKEDLAPIVSATSAIRNHFYEKTLPWSNNGDRLITRVLYMPFIEEHEKLVSLFKREVNRFLDDRYPSAVAKAEFRMGQLFNINDYPSAAELQRKFYVALDHGAIATANDFRVTLDQEHVDKIKASMEAAAEQRIHAAMGDVWRRLAETVTYFAERMNKSDAIFRDSTVNNLVELVELIPGLNLLDDPNIEAMRVKVQSMIGGVTPKEIRKDPALRAELAGDAKKIMDQMSGFMKAFGGGEA